jgi:hypothetical protein
MPGTTSFEQGDQRHFGKGSLQWKILSDSQLRYVAHITFIISLLREPSAEFHRSQTPKNPTKLPYVQVTDDAHEATTVQALNFMKDLHPKIKDFLSRPQISIWQPPEEVNEETKTFYHNLLSVAIVQAFCYTISVAA